MVTKRQLDGSHLVALSTRMGTTWPFGASLVVIGFAVYANSFAGVFIFDDMVKILQNPRVSQSLSSGAAFSARRPVVDVSLALNYAGGGERSTGYHAVNVTIHVLAALTLFGVIRRTLRSEVFHGRFDGSASWLAWVTALLWAIHPLQTQSVTYVIQRAESMMGLFYLLTLYCVIRSSNSTRGFQWRIAAIAACALGMGSKGVMVTAPVVVLMYDRVFLSRSWREPFRRRWGLYTGLGCTWLVLWFCGVVGGVLDPSRSRATIGFGFGGITALEYAQTQFGVLVRYLSLSLWPYPLCLDYNLPVTRAWSSIVLPAVVVVPLSVGSVWAVIRGRWYGFVGVWFFVILSPTSSFIPIKDTMFEHRMYLSLAGVLVMLVVGGFVVLDSLWIGYGLSRRRRLLSTVVVLLAVGTASGYTTIRRNRDYHGAITMWRRVIAVRPNNARAHENLGSFLVVAGRKHEAIAEYRRSVQLDPDFAAAQANLGNALSETGQFAAAVDAYREVLRVDPNHIEARYNRGNALVQIGLVDEAIDEFGRGIEVAREHATPLVLARGHYNLGGVLGNHGRRDEAIGEYREAIRVLPNYGRAYGDLGLVLLRSGDLEGALRACREAVRLEPRNAVWHYRLGTVLSRLGLADDGLSSFRRALELNPTHVNARRALDASNAKRRSSHPD